MSNVGTNTGMAVGHTSNVRPLDSNAPVPIRVQCAKCPSKVYKYVKVRTIYAFKRGDPRIIKFGSDRQISVELWCLSCIRAANVEDDSYRTSVSIAQS